MRWWWTGHAAAALVTAAGVLVCLLWLAGTPEATRVVADSPVIPVIVGFALMAQGSALLALLRGRRAAALLAAAVALLLSGLSLVEYLAGIDLGVERALEQAGIGPARARIAPNTALALLLAALASLLAVPRGRVWTLGIASLLGALVAAFGGVALLGYAFDLRAAFEWAGLTRMALPTAATLVVLGLAVVVTARLLARGTAAGGTLWLAGSVGTGAAVVGVLTAMAAQADGLPTGPFKVLVAGALSVAALLAGTVAQARHMRLLSLALHDSEERLRLLLDSVQAAVVVHRADSSIEFINPAAAVLLGLSRDQALGRTADDPNWHFACPDGTPMGAQDYPVSRVLADGRPLQGYVVGVVHGDGEPRWMIVNATPVRTGAGTVGQVIVSFVDITESRRQAQVYERLALTDVLTGLASRLQFGLVAERELARSRRTGESLSLLLLDVDRFKQVNDRHGHAVGDMVLRMLADCLRQQVRHVDLAVRWGGEELLVLLPGADRGQAVETAERLRHCVAGLAVQLADGTALQVTVSVGVGTLSPEDAAIDALLERADRALYAAKRGGRDRVCAQAADAAAASLPAAPQVLDQ